VLFFVARLRSPAVGGGGVEMFDDYPEVKRMYTRQRHVVGELRRLCCAGSKTRLVERASRSCGWRPACSSRRRWVFTNVRDFGDEVRLARIPQYRLATSRQASFSRRRSRSLTD
jgi:hypothetical protein